MTNAELVPNDEDRRLSPRHSCFVIPSSRAQVARRRVIRASSFLLVFLLIPPGVSHAADNLGILGAHPKWAVLEKYQETITRDDFARLIQDVYCTHGFAPDLIEINEKTARILMNRAIPRERSFAQSRAATLAECEVFAAYEARKAAIGFANSTRPRTPRREMGEHGGTMVPSREQRAGGRRRSDFARGAAAGAATAKIGRETFLRPEQQRTDYGKTSG